VSFAGPVGDARRVAMPYRFGERWHVGVTTQADVCWFACKARASGSTPHTTVGNAVTLAVRALRQDVVGAELAAPLRDDEISWLDAEFG
jgi:hypothetical protein